VTRRHDPRTSRAERREGSLGAFARLVMLVLTTLAWGTAALTLVHGLREGADAWVLTVVLGLLGDPLALVVSRRVYYATASSWWPVRVLGAPLVGPLAAGLLFLAVESSVATGGILAAVVVILTGALATALEPKRSRLERLTTRVSNFSG
jgi:hypothetical protein